MTSLLLLSVLVIVGCQAPQDVASLKLGGLTGYACVSPDGDIFVGLGDGKIVRYDSQLKTVRAEIDRFGQAGADYLAISADGSKLAVARNNRSAIDLIDLAAQRLVKQIRVEGFKLVMAVFSPDGKQLAVYVGSEYIKQTDSWKRPPAGNLFIYSAQDGTLLSQENTPIVSGWWQGMDWKGDIIAMAEVYDEGSRGVLLWDVRRHAKLRTLIHPEFQCGPLSAVLSPDAATVAVGYAPYDVAIWDVATGRILHKLASRNNWVVCLDFSPDGKLLASGEGNSAVRVWEVASGKQLHVLPMGPQDHSNYTYSVHFDPSGRRLICGRADNCIIVWQLPRR